jgi:hypothetical protein
VIFDYSGSGEHNPSSTRPRRSTARRYEDVLDRPIDPAGRDYFLGLLARGVPRSQVVSAVVYSTEHLRSIVDQYSVDFLGRQSDPGGRDYWVGQLRHGARDEQIVALIGSGEYFFGV